MTPSQATAAYTLIAFAIVLFATIVVVLATFEKMVTGRWPSFRRPRLSSLEQARLEALAEVQAAKDRMDTKAYRKACDRAKAITTLVLKVGA